MSLRFALFGRSIAHSLSPALHLAAFRARGVDATYELIDIGASEFMKRMNRFPELGLRGASVTAPYKRMAYELIHDLTEEASESLSVNTIRFDGEWPAGHNTDGIGFARFLERAGFSTEDRVVTFLGAGGAARGLAQVLRRSGARLSFVARDPDDLFVLDPDGRKGVSLLPWGSEEARRAILYADLVVQATPLGQRADDPLPCPPDWVGQDALAVDLLYHPAESPWLSALRARGVRAANGIGLLVEQALFAQEFWFGEEPPRSALEEAVPWSDPFSPPPGSARDSESSSAH
jgi:shikimate dehydrogenase